MKKKLDANKEICLIPDKILFRLPFSTLISPQNEKYFIAEHIFFVSPSANIFLTSSAKAAQLGQTPGETLLSIGNPSFNKSDFAASAKLKDLAFAKKEAEDISRFYSGPVVLTREDASKKHSVRKFASRECYPFCRALSGR